MPAATSAAMQRTLERALNLHKRGDRQAAATLYKQLLDDNPNHVDALHLLGVIALTDDAPRDAIDLISRSLAIRDDNPAAHVNLALAFGATGSSDSALHHFDRAIALDASNAGAHTGRADILAKSGNDSLAIVSYERALTLDVHNLPAWRGYGFALYRLQRYAEAVACFDRVLIKTPDDIASLYAQGNALSQIRRVDDAIARFNRVIQQKPDHAQASHQRGALQLEQDALSDALTSFDAAIAAAPSMIEAWQNRGNALARLRRPHEALESFSEALRLNPDMHEALQNRGAVLAMIGEPERALEDFDRALALRADDVATHIKRGTVLLQLKRPDDAIKVFDQILLNDPRNVQALLGQASVIKSMRRFDEALAIVDHVLELEPLHEDGIYERALILLDAGLLDASKDYAQSASRHHPDHAGLLNVHGLALQGLGRPDEALRLFERALQRDPDHADARFNASLLHLRSGDYAKGWAGFEYRWKRDRSNVRRHSQLQEWTGEHDLSGKRLLIWADEGMGDTLQFSRYADAIAARGAEVVLEVQPPLESLLTANFPGVTVISRGDAIPQCDVAIPLLSVPNALRLDRNSIPYKTAYIRADGELAAQWQARLSPTEAKTLRIGIAVSGNPAHGNDKNRSAALKDFSPLLEVGQVYIVQRGLQRADEAYLESKRAFINIGVEVEDFDHAAALLSNLDLIISVDTATAHLAGAMGMHVWLLLPFNCDWRWGLERDRTEWYPSMQIFRQTHPGVWAEPIEEMVQRLQERMDDA